MMSRKIKSILCVATVYLLGAGAPSIGFAASPFLSNQTDIELLEQAHDDQTHFDDNPIREHHYRSSKRKSITLAESLVYLRQQCHIDDQQQSVAPHKSAHSADNDSDYATQTEQSPAEQPSISTSRKVFLPQLYKVSAPEF